MVKNLLLMAVTTFVMLLAAEIGFRILFTNRDRVIPEITNTQNNTAPYETAGQHYGGQDNFADMVFDPVLTYRPKFPHQGNGYYINNLGLRHKEDMTPKKGPVSTG